MRNAIMPGKPKDRVPKAHRSREFRKSSSYPERRLWSIHRDRLLAGLKFRRQVPIGEYIVEYLCEEHRLIVEVGGESHNERSEHDIRRQEILESSGNRILRFSAEDVLRRLDGVGDAIVKASRMPLT